MFISHNWQDHHGHYLWVLSQFATSPHFYIADYSVSRDVALKKTDTELDRMIKNKVQKARVFLLIRQIDMAESEWVEREIDYAIGFRKRIIEIRADGNMKQDYPYWNPRLIIDGVRQDPARELYEKFYGLGALPPQKPAEEY